MKELFTIAIKMLLLGTVLVHSIGAVESFDQIKQSLDKEIALVGENSEKGELSSQIGMLVGSHDAKESVMASIRRNATKALLAAFSDTCPAAGSIQLRLQNRLQLLETSMSLYAGFLSRLEKRIQENKKEVPFAGDLAVIRYELKEVVNWKDLVREALSNLQKDRPEVASLLQKMQAK